MLIFLIIACEIGFWIVLSAGLFVRYGLKLPKLGKGLLMCVPLLDLILLVVTTLDLRRGSTAEFAHGLAAAYLGFTVVFGRSVIEWADQHIAYRFASGQKPLEKFGMAYAFDEWISWGKGLFACCIAACLLYLAIFFVDNPQKTEALTDWYYILMSLMFFWLIFGPIWYFLFPKKNPDSAKNSC